MPAGDESRARFEYHPLTPERWEDFVGLFSLRGAQAEAYKGDYEILGMKERVSRAAPLYSNRCTHAGWQPVQSASFQARKCRKD